MKRTEIKKIALVFFLLALVFAFLYQLKDFLKNISYFIFSPLQKFFFKVKKDILLFFETIFEIKNLKKENEALRLEIKKLIVDKESSIFRFKK
jgi:cell shape-determining protein MreC